MVAGANLKPRRLSKAHAASHVTLWHLVFAMIAGYTTVVEGRRRPLTYAITFCVFYGLAACGAESQQSTSTSLPVQVAKEILRVGSLDGADALTYPADAVISDDGLLYALFPREGRLRTVDKRGRITGSIGRGGAGPGELITPGAVDLVNDSLAVFDPPRVTLFPLSSGEPRTFQLPSAALLTRDGPSMIPVGIFATGETLLWPPISRTGLEPHLDERRRLYLFGENGHAPTPMVEVNQANRTVMYRDPDATGAQAVFGPHPFSNNDRWAMHGSGKSLVLLDRSTFASEGGVRVLLISPAGDTISGARIRLGAPRQITEAEIDSVIAAEAEFLLETRGARPPSLAVGKRWVRRALGTLPAFHPPVETLLAASDGTIWLERYGNVGGTHQAEWLRLDERGVPKEWVLLPPAMRLLAARNRLAWATVTDDFDVPYLVMLRLEPATGSKR